MNVSGRSKGGGDGRCVYNFTINVYVKKNSFNRGGEREIERERHNIVESDSNIIFYILRL